MILSIIVAVDENHGIGLRNQIPWHLPGDLDRFKKLTMGHHLIAGRKTYQSIGSALPGRQMIVLTRDSDFIAEGCLVANSLEEALNLAKDDGEQEAFIIGGAEIYRQALVLADRLYITRVQGAFEADTHFPDFSEDDWVLVCEQEFPADEKNSYPHVFFHYLRAPEKRKQESISG